MAEPVLTKTLRTYPNMNTEGCWSCACFGTSKAEPNTARLYSFTKTARGKTTTLRGEFCGVQCCRVYHDL